MCDGNTPTCVGKTNVVNGVSQTMKKHPHVRGEDRALGFPEDILPRNTPTCVGKTIAIRTVVSDIWKHPHVRGEDTEGLFTFFAEPSKQY